MPWMARTPDGSGFAEMTEQEHQLWALIDGKRSIEALSRLALSWPSPAGPAWVGATLRKLAAGRLLEEQDWMEAEPAGNRLYLRLTGPVSPRLVEQLLNYLGGFAFYLLPIPCLLLTGLEVMVNGLDLMPLGTSPWTFLLSFWTVLCASQIARAAAYLSISRPLESMGIGTFWGFPTPAFEPPRVSPVEHRRAALWGIASHLLIAGLAGTAALMRVSPVASQLVTLALVILLVELGPILQGDGRLLIVAWSRDEDVIERTAAFTWRRLLPKLLSKEPFQPEEKRLLLVSGLIALWAVTTLRACTYLFRSSMGGFAKAVSSQASPLTVTLGVTIVVVAIGVMAFAFIKILVTPIRLMAASGIRGEPVARWMLPLAVLAAPLAWLPSPQLLGAFHLLVLLAVLVLLSQQFRAIPGSRLGRGYFYFWIGLLAQAAAAIPRMLHAMNSFDVSLLPAAYFHVLDMTAPFGLSAFGVLAVLEASRSRLVPIQILAALIPVVAGAGVAATAPELAQRVMALPLSLAVAGAILIWTDRSGTPMRNFWRPFVLATILLTAACWMESSPPATIGLPERFMIAGLVFTLAALLASRAMFAVPMPVHPRPDGSRSGATPREALWDGGYHLLGNIVGIAAFFLGERRGEAITESFNARLSGNAHFPIRLENGRLVPGAIELPEQKDLVASLREGLGVLEAEVVSSAGRQFFDRALAVSTEGLYWLEWEQVHLHLLSAIDRESTRAQLIEEVSRIPLFRELSPTQLEEMVRLLRRERFLDGSYIVRQGELGDRFYGVKRGKLDVLHEDAMGHQRRLATLLPGDCFGELALLGSGLRTASVRALGEVEVISLGKNEFELYVPDKENVTTTIRHGGYLTRIPLFSRLPSTVLPLLAARLETTTHPPDETVLPAGSGLDWLLMVKEGALTDGSVPFGPGEAYGQQSIVGGQTLPADVKTIERSTVLRLPARHVRDAVRDWIDGFADLRELAERHGSIGWESAE